MTHEDPEVRWTSYIEAQARILHPTLGQLKIEPASRGVADGPFPAGAGSVYLITAANPGRLLTDHENAQRHEQLRVTVSKANPSEVWDAAGGDEGWIHVETSLAVVGITLDIAMTIARSFEQEAIFVWSAKSWQVVACDGSRTFQSGWRVSTLRTS